jgi:hypothetical protein
LLILSIGLQNGKSQFSYQKLVDKNNYEKAFVKAKKAIKKSPSDIKTNYNMAMLYYLYCNENLTTFNYSKLKYNIDKAYFYSKKIKQLQKQQKSIISETTITELAKNICNLAYKIITKKTSQKIFQHTSKNTKIVRKILNGQKTKYWKINS